MSPRSAIRDWVRASERSEPEEQWALLCFLAGRERHARRGRAATRPSGARSCCSPPAAIPGAASSCTGAPSRRSPTISTTRPCAPSSPPVSRRSPEVEGLRGATEALRLLRRDGELAWQCFAMALLADELAGDERPGRQPPTAAARTIRRSPLIVRTRSSCTGGRRVGGRCVVEPELGAHRAADRARVDVETLRPA